MKKRESIPEVQGSFLIGVSQTFLDLSAITQVECDNLVLNIDPIGWYPLAQLFEIFELLEESGRSSSPLLFQAGCTMMQSWYEQEGKELGLGSMGQLMLSDNSVGLKMVMRNLDPKIWYTNVLGLDTEKGFAQLEFSCGHGYPPTF